MTVKHAAQNQRVNLLVLAVPPPVCGLFDDTAIVKTVHGNFLLRRCRSFLYACSTRLLRSFGGNLFSCSLISEVSSFFNVFIKSAHSTPRGPAILSESRASKVSLVAGADKGAFTPKKIILNRGNFAIQKVTPLATLGAKPRPARRRSPRKG